MSDELGQDTPEPRAGIGRRTLIKRAAAAGAVAWTAPVILDSLASPAAAASCAKCFKFGIQAVNTGNANPTKTDNYPVLSYNVGTCLPNGDANCVAANEKQNVNFSALGITLTNPFQVNLPSTNQVTVSMAQSGTFSGAGCRTPFQIIGTSFIWRSTGSDPRFPSGTGDNGVCERAKPGDSPTTGNLFPNNHLVAVSSSSVTWTMPASLKPGHSGGFNFVIGCDCG